jgi:hypothetical protein
VTRVFLAALALLLAADAAAAQCYSPGYGHRRYYRSYRTYYRTRYVKKVIPVEVPVAVFAPYAVQVPSYSAAYVPPAPLPAAPAAAPAPPAAAPAASGCPTAEIMSLLKTLDARLGALEKRTLAPPPREGVPPPREERPRGDGKGDRRGGKEDDKEDDNQQVAFLAHAAARCAACHTEGSAPKGDFVAFRKGAPEKLAALVRREARDLPRLEKDLSAAMSRLSDKELGRLEDESFAAWDADTLKRMGRYLAAGKCPPAGNSFGIPPLSARERQTWAEFLKSVKPAEARRPRRPGRGEFRFARR